METDTMSKRYECICPAIKRHPWWQNQLSLWWQNFELGEKNQNSVLKLTDKIGVNAWVICLIDIEYFLDITALDYIFKYCFLLITDIENSIFPHRKQIWKYLLKSSPKHLLLRQWRMINSIFLMLYFFKKKFRRHFRWLTHFNCTILNIPTKKHF